MEKFRRGPVKNTGDGSEKDCVGFIVKDNHHRGRGHPRWILALQTSVYRGERKGSEGEGGKVKKGRRGREGKGGKEREGRRGKEGEGRKEREGRRGKKREYGWEKWMRFLEAIQSQTFAQEIQNNKNLDNEGIV